MIEELIEKLHKGELSKDDYPCLNDPSQTFHGTSQTATVNHASVADLAQSKRTHKWARPRNSDDRYSSDSILRYASSDFKKMGQQICVSIIGGATRFEKLKTLTAHELSIDDL